MNSSRHIRAAVVAAALVLPLSTAGAQCPDGSPPPCRSSQASAPAPRRVNPPIDDNTWIVVPFDNLSKSEDAEWLRSASVNLLYLDMSRWRDIRVVDDERVADLLRETPEAANANVLSLNAGLAVARRAGAGRLVMGDVLKLGNRTTVTAKIYDVKSGQRTRSVREDATVADSVMPLFGKLAQKILNVAPPAGASLGAIGTSRVDAYQAYLAGVTALNRFDLQEARRHLTQAIALDSTFALAHYKMSIVIGWGNTGDPSQARHAESAARFQAGLPPRARALITGLVHQSKNEWGKACEVYGALARADSSDVEAVYGMGECLYHDSAVLPTDGDTTRLRFGADWDRSIKAFRRVLELDPQYHLAYQHIIDALTAERHILRSYCPEGGRCRQMTGFNVRLGDSLVAAPVAVNDTAGLRAQAAQYLSTRSKARNLAAAREVAEQWVRNAPDEVHARAALGTVLLAQGNVAEADALFANLKDPGTFIERLRLWLSLMETSYKLGRTARAAQLYDSARASNLPLPNASGLQWGNVISGYGLAFGRLAEYDSLLAAQMRMVPPPIYQAQRHGVRAVLGLPPGDTLTVLMQTIYDSTRAARGLAAATRAIGPALVVALRTPRVWPELDTATRDLKSRPAVALSRGDTTALRAAARALDSAARASFLSLSADTGFTVAAAEAYLALRDSASALRIVRFGLDSAAAVTTYFPLLAFGPSASTYAPRLMLLRADLAAAAGSRDEAREFYRRFIDAFSRASPELQPLVERARKSRDALGPGS